MNPFLCLDNFNVENSQAHDGDPDQTPTNTSNDHGNNNGDDILSTLIFERHRPINTSSPNTTSVDSENSSLLSEILHANNTTALLHGNVIDRTTGSDDRLQNEFLPSVDDIMNQLTMTLDDEQLSIKQPSKYT